MGTKAAKAKKHPTKINWTEVRTWYYAQRQVDHTCDLKRVANHFGIAYQTVRKAAAREKWNHEIQNIEQHFEKQTLARMEDIRVLNELDTRREMAALGRGMLQLASKGLQQLLDKGDIKPTLWNISQLAQVGRLLTVTAVPMSMNFNPLDPETESDDDIYKLFERQKRMKHLANQLREFVREKRGEVVDAEFTESKS